MTSQPNDGEKSSPSTKGVLITACASVLVAIIGFFGLMLRPSTEKSSHIFSGRVMSRSAGIPIYKAHLQISVDQAIPQHIDTDSDGVFSIDVPSAARSMRIIVMADGFDTFERDADPNRTGLEIIYLDKPVGQAGDSTHSNVSPRDLRPTLERRVPIQPSKNDTTPANHGSDQSSSLSSNSIPHSLASRMALIGALDAAPLGEYSGTTISIRYIQQDPETERVASRIVLAANAAEWKVVNDRAIGISDFAARADGDYCKDCIVIAATTGSIEAGKRLSHWLEQARVKVSFRKIESPGQGFVRVLVNSEDDR